ncbi:O-methyltransferase [Cuneatibacter caecimuris]|uniref:tRNA 5-hydroxyuridine methyltransferase n=1 Tax=Cuneatibacter caecimuris TaxID=1796618 RepID=A0A4Q7PNU1_9FIRM|nr:O-methyltransferase [Cuneatibacter caecimuris]RZT02641.1 putative O-methyltransferase YrrM [Cuneatibacter caecimuris]
MEWERIGTFIRSLEEPGTPLLEEIRREALAEDVPVIRPETGSFLKTLLLLKRPKQVLEVGTAVGYSALLMCEALEEDGRITTIEKYEKRIPKARENFRRAGRQERITLLEGDAAEILKGLEGPFDMIFMDAAKGQYLNFLPDALRLLAPGGLMVSDNILQDGDVLESRFAVARRDRTIHSRMREYLYLLKHTKGLATSIVPIGDGVAVSVKE